MVIKNKYVHKNMKLLKVAVVISPSHSGPGAAHPQWGEESVPRWPVSYPDKAGHHFPVLGQSQLGLSTRLAHSQVQ